MLYLPTDDDTPLSVLLFRADAARREALAPFAWTTSRVRALYHSELSDRMRQVRGWRKVRLRMPAQRSPYYDC